MESALFFRKCPNKNDYFKLANNYPDLGSKLNFKIEITVVLSEYEYEEFTNNFLKDNDVLINNKDSLFMDEFDLVHCAYFTIDGVNGFLVYPSGFSYARYVAFYQLGQIIMKGDKDV